MARVRAGCVKLDLPQYCSMKYVLHSLKMEVDARPEVAKSVKEDLYVHEMGVGRTET
jgi:hypothetical protein